MEEEIEESVDDIRRRMSDRPAQDYQPRQGRRQRPPRQPRQRSQFPAKPKQPTAPVEASSLGQLWYDLGKAQGFDFPYDANFFALALDKKIQADKRFRKVFDRGEDEKVGRWVRKMIEVWWGEKAEYITNDVSARNAKEYFLVEDWEDVQEYARSSLRAAYLKEHGVAKPPPQYPDQQKFVQALDQIEREGRVRRYVETVDLEAEPPELDESGRERLRSFRDRRRTK